MQEEQGARVWQKHSCDGQGRAVRAGLLARLLSRALPFAGRASPAPSEPQEGQVHTDEQEGGREERETARKLRARDKAGRGPRGRAGKVHVWTRGQDEARGLTAVGVGALKGDVDGEVPHQRAPRILALGCDL